MLIIIKFAPTHDSRIFRGGFKGMEFNVGIGGRVPGELAPYVAMGHLLLIPWRLFKTLLASCGKICGTYLITVMWLENFKLVILFNN
jgi:hypothetical protein